MFHLGLDDTDSLRGGCTTHLAIRVLEELVLEGAWDLLGFPRLVRLNPNVPWKTRGNGAVALALGKGAGQTLTIGEIGTRPIEAHARGTPEDNTPTELAELVESLGELVEKWSHTGQENTNPGLVITKGPLAASHYWKRVRSVVAREDNLALLDRKALAYRSWGNGRGLIGAVGALAWPAGWVSYELLAYRFQKNWGTVRQLRRTGLERLEFEPGTFDSYNPHTDQVVVAPKGPDPVLFGLRGLYPPLLRQAAEGLAGHGPVPEGTRQPGMTAEPMESWCLWATNQGSDDHVRAVCVAQVGPCASYRLRGRVVATPRKQRGGHLFFQLRDGSGTLECAAFEPGKPLPALLERLRPGDEVEVFGGTPAARDEQGTSPSGGPEKGPTGPAPAKADDPSTTLLDDDGPVPQTLAVEKLRFIYSASERTKVANPRCMECGKAMKSLGQGAGYRCKPCRRWAPEEAADFAPRPPDERLSPGWYEPPPGQRRHLARPRVLLEGDEWHWERSGWSM